MELKIKLPTERQKYNHRQMWKYNGSDYAIITTKFEFSEPHHHHKI